MAARPRSTRRRGWPDNLYESRGYYSYRNPTTGDWYGLGRDRQAAFQQAQEANIHLAGLRDRPRLIDRLTGEAERSLDAFLDIYSRQLEKLELEGKRSIVTRRQDKWKIAQIRKHSIAQLPVTRLEDDPRLLAEFIAQWYDAGKERMAQSMRSFLVDIFHRARGQGWVKVNPAEALEKITGLRVRRARLLIDAFKAITAAAEKHLDPWAANAMLLALISGQRREEIASATFKPRARGRVWIADDYMWIRQQKTGQRLRIPLVLRCEAIGMTLGQVVKRCRDSVVSDYLVHHTSNYGNAPSGSKVHVDTISRSFQDARDLSGLVWPESNEDDLPQTPPTFHEIRSLSERVYAEQGIDTQTLLGHRDPQSTQRYRDSRGAEWTEIKLASAN